MTLDHSALWSMYASLEELRGKIGHVLKCAIQMSKVAWSNVIAKRCRRVVFPETRLPVETVRKGSRASTLGPQSSEIELLRPLSLAFEAPLWSLSRVSDSFSRTVGE